MKKLSMLSILVAAVSLSFSQASLAASDCGEIVLGSAISLTGKYATNGIHAKNGYEYAIVKIREAGGVKVGGKCYNFKVIYYDDESKGDRGATLAERLISQDNVQYMLGPYSSGMTKAIAPVTEKYQIPMIEAEGASRSLFNKGYKYLFAVLSTSEQYLASAISLAAEKAEESGKPTSSVKVAIAVENDPFSLDVRAGVMDDAASFGMNVVIDEKLPRDLTHCEAADVTGNFGKAADDILCSTQWAETLSYKDPLFGSAAEYETDFKVSFPEYLDKKVPYQTAQASAAVYVFKDAFERANSLDKEKLRDAISATDMMTFYGGIKFSSAGNNIAKPMVLRQIQNGEYNVVAPSKFASHKLNWPRN